MLPGDPVAREIPHRHLENSKTGAGEREPRQAQTLVQHYDYRQFHMLMLPLTDHSPAGDQSFKLPNFPCATSLTFVRA